jgi:hypothetical protein
MRTTAHVSLAGGSRWTRTERESFAALSNGAIVAGVSWVIVGARHARLAAVGALLLAGGVAAGVRRLHSGG